MRKGFQHAFDCPLLCSGAVISVSYSGCSDFLWSFPVFLSLEHCVDPFFRCDVCNIDYISLLHFSYHLHSPASYISWLFGVTQSFLSFGLRSVYVGISRSSHSVVYIHLSTPILYILLFLFFFLWGYHFLRVDVSIEFSVRALSQIPRCTCLLLTH